jgi:hypothetical protein
MKIKIIIIICFLVLLNSCIVKSLQPFYTQESIAFQEVFIGNWNDNKKGNWKVAALKEEFEKDNKDLSELSKEDKEIFKKYKDGYLVTYTKKEKEAVFIAMPFKIGNQVFMDFIPFDYDNLNSDLLSQHLLKTHSVAKFEVLEGNSEIKVNWLDEERLKALYDNNQIQLKHEVIGLDEAFVLTASSEELYKFLEKYIASNIKDKWKSSNEYTLKRNDAKP